MSNKVNATRKKNRNQPNNNILFSLSNINNPYTQPSSIIYSLNPSVSVGQQIVESPPNFMWNRFIDGTYSELRLTFLGNDLSPLTINDSNMTILLVIKDQSEVSIS
jgi:predicted transcriptional regulator